MNRHLFRGSRTNRDRRDQSFARSVIAEATRRHNATQTEIDNTAVLMRSGDIEVCPDCFGSCETEQHVTDDVTRMLPCPECGGKGWVS